MKHTAIWALAGITCAGLLGVGTAATAQEAVTATFETSATGGIHAMVPVKLQLSSERPKNLTREPAYSGKPQYGVIRLGDAGNNQIVVALDNPGGNAHPHLYVDANGNGDLTDDTPVVMTLQPAATAGKGGSIAANADNDSRWLAVVPVLAHYDVPGRAGTVPSSIQFTLWGADLTYNREYNRSGTLKIGGHTYRAALVDQTVTGRFNDFKHSEDDAAKVVLLIDRKGTGVFDLRRDMFDAAKPFRLGGSVYEVSAIDARGTLVSLKRSSKAVHGVVTAADLKVGSETIDFDAATTSGRSVHFPDDYKGKIVLLDFWATWCPPCRDEVPNIVATYKQSHAAGFDILGISLDRPNAARTLADYTSQMGMSWSEVYDGGYWKAEVAQLYGVNAIPMSYLVDGDTGIILAMGDDLRGQGLEAEVANALRKKKR